jgi:hypothetical protein
MNSLTRTKQRPGWVRGDMAKTVDDLERLAAAQERVRELEAQVTELRSEEDKDTALFAQGTDQTVVSLVRRHREQDKVVSFEISWNELFVAVGNVLLRSPLESDVRGGIATCAKNRLGIDKGTMIWIENDELERIKRQLLALKLINIDYATKERHDQIQRRTRISRVSRGTVVTVLWHLSSRGTILLARLTAVPREGDRASNGMRAIEEDGS